MKFNLSLNIEAADTDGSQEHTEAQKNVEKSIIREQSAKDFAFSELQNQAIEMKQPLKELGKVSNCRDAVTHGNPEILGNHMDYQQGVEINGLMVLGNCGLDSSRNMLALCGKHYTEEFITKTAAQNKLCDFNPKLPAKDRGGTTSSWREKLLEKFSVEVESISQKDITLDEIADKLDVGKRGIISLNAGILRNEISSVSTDSKGNPRSNHVVTLLSAVRDRETGELAGFYICDSGSEISEPFTYVTVDRMKKAFTGVTNACVQMTKKSYAEVSL